MHRYHHFVSFFFLEQTLKIIIHVKQPKHLLIFANDEKRYFSMFYVVALYCPLIKFTAKFLINTFALRVYRTWSFITSFRILWTYNENYYTQTYSPRVEGNIFENFLCGSFNLRAVVIEYYPLIKIASILQSSFPFQKIEMTL